MRRFLPPVSGLFLIALSSAVLAPAAFAPAAFAQSAPAGFTTLSDGVMMHDDTLGTGATAQSGHLVTVQYTGWLYVNGQKGQKFDSSYDRGQPFKFVLDNGQVIAGWDAGVQGMKVGGVRTLIIPPDQAYGDQGAGDAIPPGATLIFDIALVGTN